MKKININVVGMHCHSCEIIIEKSLKKLPDVSKVIAHQNKWLIEIYFERDAPDLKKIEKIVIENWYALWIAKKLPWINKNMNDYVDILMIWLVLYIIFIIFKWSGISIWSVWGSGSPTLWVAFLIWLTAWVSSCMALVWWLTLWISASWNKGKENISRWSKFEPHLFFNLWRVLGFWLFGWILWLFGSFISLSNVFLGFMTFLVWAVMLLLWLNLTNISPRLGNISITLPKFLWKNVWWNNSGWSKKWAMITWAMSFFLPCWFTLAMQMYAISTWSFVTWALSLGLFALGTAPWLIWIWGLTAVLKWAWAKKFFKFTGTIVLLLWFFNLANWYNLLSLWIPSAPSNQNVDTSSFWTQTVTMTQSDSWYSPNIINIKPNTKIKLIVTSTNPYTCASQLMIPSLWIQKSLKQWENEIDFVSPASWEIKFSCSMWMYTGKFVIDWNLWNSANVSQNNIAASNQNTWRSSGWCSMMWGWSSVKTPTTTVNSASDWDIETVKLSYTSSWLSGNISAKVWKKYKIVIDVKDTISGCMSTILIPGLDENTQSLNAWSQVVFNITPTQSWQFPITCAMWRPHWYINIE